MTENEQEYHDRVLHGVLDAVVMANAVEGAEGGVVDLPVAIEALIATIATLAAQSGNYPTPRNARSFGEACGKSIAQIMRGIAARPIDWSMERLGKLN